MRTTLIALALTFGVTACSAPAEEAPAPEETVGNPAVYERINGLTDCAELQKEFDTASTHNDGAEPGTDEYRATTAYMEAADARMQEVGCY
jgi:hypothetical protein